MSDLVFRVNGEDCPIPSEFNWSVQQVSSPDSGRTLDGMMHVERVTRKEKIGLKWAAKTPAETSQILQLFSGEYFQVTYRSPLTNSIVTKTFYSGDQSSPYYWWVRNGLLESITFNIIER